MSDKLPQDEINKLNSENTGSLKYLNEKEVNIAKEISTVSMGAAITTLSMLLGNKVEILNPQVNDYDTIEDLLSNLKGSVFIEINYESGLEGKTVFVLTEMDTAIIADLMMGGDGKVSKPEIGDLQLSAVGEAMNQMMGTSVTALSSVFNTNIEFSAPVVKSNNENTNNLSDEFLNVPVVAVFNDLKVEGLIDSKIIQISPISTNKTQLSKLTNMMDVVVENVVKTVNLDDFGQSKNVLDHDYNIGAEVLPEINPVEKPVTVQPVQFTSFNDYTNVYGESGKNLDLLMDVKLKLTVELGRSELAIKKVLELTRGSIIELDKVAGEPVELFANGKLIAKGEVVVIEDNFGLRITSIVSPDNRIKHL